MSYVSLDFFFLTWYTFYFLKCWYFVPVYMLKLYELKYHGCLVLQFICNLHSLDCIAPLSTLQWKWRFIKRYYYFITMTSSFSPSNTIIPWPPKSFWTTTFKWIFEVSLCSFLSLYFHLSSLYSIISSLSREQREEVAERREEEAERREEGLERREVLPEVLHRLNN